MNLGVLDQLLILLKSENERPATMESCETCRFFKKFEYADFGQCRRHAATGNHIYWNNGTGIALNNAAGAGISCVSPFPLPRKSDWCGDFEELESAGGGVRVPVERTQSAGTSVDGSTPADSESVLESWEKSGKRVYRSGTHNTICVNCGHFINQHHPSGECPDHNYSATCCGGVP